MDNDYYNSYTPDATSDDTSFDIMDEIEWANQYAERNLSKEIEDYSDDNNMIQQRNQVQEILQIFLTRRQDVLQLIERYGVPRRISRALTTRIIQFVLNNAAQIPGDIERRTSVLFRQFMNSDNLTVAILRIFNVPFNIINQYIREVIRITLRNIVTIPPIPPQPDINERVRQISLAFEQQHPNFLGLTTVYRIPIAEAREIVRGIVRFTLVNLDRIPQTGTIQQRADAMLRLLDAQRPDLIRAMINRGVPAGQAEAITRQIIIFTLSRVR